MSPKKRLGRGLDALLGNSDLRQAVETPEKLPENELKHLAIDLVQRGKYQPRREMDQESLQELANSIKAQGVIQPLVVRQLGTDKYELIAGERRWRAAQLVGLEAVPVVVRDVTDQMASAMALIENMQRQDLNPLEEAVGLQRLIDEFGLTHQSAGDAVGRSRVSVSNMLRLLDLHDEVKQQMETGALDMGHARALLSLPAQKQIDAARKVIDKDFSVRQTEALVRQMLQPAVEKTVAPRNPDIQRLETELSETLGTTVAIQGGKKGKLVISYSSLDELDGILQHIR